MNTTPRLSVSREGRDTLWLLLMVALSMLPHVPRLPLWCSVGATVALLWRAQVAWRDTRLPPRWVLLVALVASVALTLSTHHALFSRESGVTLVVVLSGLKTLEFRARRDAFVITSLAFFLILTQFMYSQHLALAALMLITVWGLLTSLVLAQRPLGRPPLLQAGAESGRILLMGAPLMVVLFLLFPRMGPLWSLPTDAQGRTGLSNSMTLGNVSELALDDGVAMHIRFDGVAPEPASLYFRGPVLSQFDGVTWRTNEATGQDASQDLVETRGPPIHYQVTLESSGINVVPLLEATLQARTPPRQTTLNLHRQGLNWISPNALHERVQLDAVAWTQFRHGPTQATPALHQWLMLPRGFNPRTLAWATRLHQSPAMVQASPRELSQAVLSHIRKENFHYTLMPGNDGAAAGEAPPLHQIDQFWLNRRTGFCEHFATSFVVVMRAMGVPSRVVTGYQGAELNPVNGLYIVRNSHAHAWAEFWQPGEGWVRADPTAAVAPERIDRSRPLARPKNPITNALSGFDSPLWSKGKALLEATNHRWNVWVLQYSRGRQTELLRKLGWEASDGSDIARALAIALSSIALAGVLWLWLTRERAQRSPWQGPMAQVHRALLSAGWPAPIDNPSPASALSWIRVIEATAPRMQVQQKTDPHKLIAALRQLDALAYGPMIGPEGQPLSTRRLLVLAKPLVQQIQDLARQSRNRQAQRHRAH